MKQFTTKILAGLWFALIPFALFAQKALAILSPMFSDHMVLQRDMNVPVLGFGAPGEKLKCPVAVLHGSWAELLSKHG